MSSFGQTVYYVDQSATGNEDGSSWTNAFTNLNTAIESVNTGDSIKIAEGVYVPDRDSSGLFNPVNPRLKTFFVDKDLILQGGYSTGGSMRNWDQFQTVLSGDLDGNDLNFDGDFSNQSTDSSKGNNAYSLLHLKHLSSQSIFEGLYIVAGRADSAIQGQTNGIGPRYQGGGLFNSVSGNGNSSSPTIRYCKFFGNFASDGGAISNNAYDTAHTAMRIHYCVFSGNRATEFGGAISNGAALHATNQVIISHCQLIKNKSNWGGGLFQASNGGDFSPSVTNCLFSENIAANEGGGTWSYCLGSIASFSPKIISCDFLSNQATTGAAIQMTNYPATPFSPVISKCRISGNFASGDGGGIHILTYFSNADVVLDNCLITGNKSLGKGGGIYSSSFNSQGTVNIYNCSIVGNKAGDGGGVNYHQVGVQPIISNSILWNNEDNGGSGNGAQWSSCCTTPTITYSLITGINFGVQNLSSNPQFINATLPSQAPTTGGDFRLQPSSPAIDAGQNDSLPTGIFTDLAGNPRLNNGTVDLGPLEYYSIPLPLLHFDLQAIPTDNVIKLQWEISGYIGNGEFIITKTIGGNQQTFREIGAIKQINIEGKSLYKFIYDDLYSSRGVYQIRFVDQNGIIWYSNKVEVRGKDSSYPVLFPNPSSNYVILEIHNNEEVDSIYLIDLNGRKTPVKLELGNRVSLTSFPNGYYHFELTTKNKVWHLPFKIER